MIVSVHLADVGLRAAPGVLRHRPRPSGASGLLYAQTTITVPLSKSLLPSPQPGRVGLIAAWEDDGALEGFLANDPLAERLAGGWHARLEPLRVYGAWPWMPGLPTQERPVAEEEPVAVLTLGQLRYRRAIPFARASARAEEEALAHPALVASTGLTRPPLVATFSLWRSAAGMLDYARRRGAAHPAAVRAHAAKPFHRATAFIRFRPLASQGSWGGRDPLAAMRTAAERPTVAANATASLEEPSRGSAVDRAPLEHAGR
jgi:hypothetical protein